jgi:hypothetical protein
MRHFRSLAAEQDIRFIACRRSVCALKQSLTGAGLCEQSCASCPQRQAHNKQAH